MNLKIFLCFTIFCTYGVYSQVCSSLCVFPFYYNGMSFNTCTNYMYSDYWCGRRTNATDNEADWSICGADCPRTPFGQENTLPPPVSTQPCLTTSGLPCQFPFVYRANIYFRCTVVEYDGTPWCAQTTDDNGVMTTWGVCGSSCANVG